MKKSELKTGMVVQLREKSMGLVLNDRILFNNSYMRLDETTDTLCDPDGENKYDIIKVFKNNVSNSLLDLLDINCLELIWERKEDKQVSFMEAFSFLQKNTCNDNSIYVKLPDYKNRFYCGAVMEFEFSETEIGEGEWYISEVCECEE